VAEQSDREYRIRELAFHLWEAAGCPEGQAAHFWEEAERHVDAGQDERAELDAVERKRKGPTPPDA
jgi:DUF2934 family protein